MADDEKEDLDGWAKNWSVIKGQWSDYKEHCKEVITPEVKAAWEAKDYIEVLHKCHAYTEEIIDYNKRIYSYLAYPRRLYEAAGLAAIVAWFV